MLHRDKIPLHHTPAQHFGSTLARAHGSIEVSEYGCPLPIAERKAEFQCMRYSFVCDDSHAYQWKVFERQRWVTISVVHNCI